MVIEIYAMGEKCDTLICLWHNADRFWSLCITEKDAVAIHLQGVQHEEQEDHLEALLHEGRGDRQVRGMPEQPPHRRQPRMVAGPPGKHY